MDGLQQLTLDSLKTPDGINQVNRILRAVYENIAGDGEGVRVFTGIGSPEGAITAGIGSLYLRSDGAVGTSFYKKTSGTGNTGWTADSSLTLPLTVANGGTGADNSLIAQGYIPYMSATGVISWLAPGTSGYVLKTQGAAANPAWTAPQTLPVGYNLVSITPFTAVADSGNIAITNTKHYFARVILTAITNPHPIWIRFNNDSTVNTYSYIYNSLDTSAVLTNGNSAAGATKIITGPSQGPGATSYTYLDFYMLPQASSVYHTYGKIFGTALFSDFYGFWDNATAVTSFKVLPSSENITGTVYLYELTTA